MENVKSVMIISSNNYTCEYLSRILDEMEIPYVFERDETRAIARILEMNIRLVVVDMKSLVSDNLDFLKLTRKIWPRLPIIAIADDSSKDELNKFYDPGVTYFFMKPINKKKISDIITSISTELTDKDNDWVVV